MEHPPARGATRAHWVCVDNTVWALRAVRAVADKALIDRQMTVLPVRLSGQAKPLINSAPRCYPPPHTVAAPPQRHTTSQETTWRPPLPGVSLFRRFCCHLGNLVCAPVRGTFAVAWNIAVRTRGVFTHRTGFQKLACAERGLVRTGRPRQTHTIQKTALWRTQGT